jgi:serine/threonine protein kinase
MDKREMIDERYRLEEPLGKGGMARVWRATDVRLERPVAIKIIAQQLAEDPEFLVRFFSEAQAVAGISHPCVVSVLDFGQFKERPYLVMEYMPGGAIADLVGRPIEYERALEIVRDAAHGVGAAHAMGIVHRDIKPGNILLTEEGRSKIADFGIALTAVSEKLTSTGQVIGSPHYISPEQATGEGAGPESDVYALGVVLYELITGRPPFDANNATAIALAHVESDPEPPSQSVEVPGEVEAVVLRCLSKKPSERFQSGSALAAAIEELIGRDRTAAISTGVLGAGVASTQRTESLDTDEMAPVAASSIAASPVGGRRKVAMIVGAALIAVLLIAGGVFAFANRDDPGAQDSIETNPENRALPSPNADETVEESAPGIESTPTSTPTEEATPDESDRDNSGRGGGGSDSNGGPGGGGTPPPTPEETPEEEPSPQESPSV